MQDIAADIERWFKLNLPVGLATVIKTWGSSPRGVGAKMAFTLGEKIAGSVSGGCVESAVYETGLEVMKTGQAKLLHFGVTDETAFDVGLACGGSIDIWVVKLNPTLFFTTLKAINSNKPVAIVSLIQNPLEFPDNQAVVTEDGFLYGSFNKELDTWIHKTVCDLFLKTGAKTIYPNLSAFATSSIFLDIINPAPVLVMIGGVHISIALASIAKTLGYYTIVVDPRRSFGNQERFPHVDQLIQAWPDEAFNHLSLTIDTHIAVLTHDPKIDDPALKIALNNPIGYIGALGSRNTHQKRRQRLMKDGLSEAQIDRIHSPIGLDLGGSTPEEIALAIMAQIVSYRTGK